VASRRRCAAAFRAARGAIVATLDGDGQNNPAFLPDLIAAVEKGANVGLAAGPRVGRKDTGFKKCQSRVANGVRNGILKGRHARYWLRAEGVPARGVPDDALFRRAASGFCRALVRREGFDIAYVDVIDRPRRSGVSLTTASFDRLWIGIMDLAGVWWLIRRKKPTPDMTEVKA